MVHGQKTLRRLGFLRPGDGNPSATLRIPISTTPKPTIRERRN